MDIENLNLMSRVELTESLKCLQPASIAAEAIHSLMQAPPSHFGVEPGEDQFEVLFKAAIIEDISEAVSTVAYGEAEVYSAQMEQNENTVASDVRFQFLQAISEKWGYLELAAE